MTWIHAGSVTMTGQGRAVPLWVMLVIVGGGLLLIHAVRATRVDERVAQEWMRQRNLPNEQRSVSEVAAYLRRLRWSRVGSTGLLIAVCGLSLVAAKTWVSFVSLPFLLSVLAAEALAPEPRRGRMRVATLQRRSRSFYAPPIHLALARVAIAAGAALSLGGAAFGPTSSTSAALIHGVVMAVGALALEMSLYHSVVRALPDRQPDAAVDAAMRVASSRTATAAGLVFGVFGLLLSLAFSGIVGEGLGARILSQSLTVTMIVTFVVALNLLQPLASWQPRSAR